MLLSLSSLLILTPSTLVAIASNCTDAELLTIVARLIPLQPHVIFNFFELNYSVNNEFSAWQFIDDNFDELYDLHFSFSSIEEQDTFLSILEERSNSGGTSQL